ncbi:PEP-CTERM sorting domain-containing protein [Massilia horti]|uniref:PEP-CTERM sorting domain-containing protein n=1 Tax=Massilia horti TaxID=2562153 RepID=UPI001430DF2E|nr:PEP-CTERM sorting domain-containing protein [Massilia horti]
MKKKLGAVVGLGVATFAVFLLLLAYKSDADSPVRPAVIDAARVTPTAVSTPAAPVANTSTRRVYPYSIIPGGVSNRDELVRVIKTDKVVAEHYASFNAEVAVELIVTKPRAVYVSYRKGDKIFWTAKKVMLAEGEMLLSDGHSEIRARCGNRISDVPQLPVERGGPTEEELDSSIEVAQDAIERPELYAVQFSMDDLPPFGGQAYQLVTFANGAGLVTSGSEPLSRRQLPQFAMAGGVDRNLLTPAAWQQLGTASTSGSRSEPSGSESGNTPGTPPVLAPSPTESDGPGKGSGNQTPPGDTTPPTKPADPDPAKPNPGEPGPPTQPTDPAPTKPDPSDPGLPIQPTDPGPTKPNPGDPGLPIQPTDPGPIKPTDPNPTNPGPGPEEPPVIIDELPWPPQLPNNPVDPGKDPHRGGEVPEPATLWLSGAALVGMLLVGRKKSRSKG